MTINKGLKVGKHNALSGNTAPGRCRLSASLSRAPRGGVTRQGVVLTTLTLSKGAAGRGKTACPVPCALTEFCAPEIWERWRLFFGLRCWPAIFWRLLPNFFSKFRQRPALRALFPRPDGPQRAGCALRSFLPRPGGAQRLARSACQGPWFAEGICIG